MKHIILLCVLISIMISCSSPNESIANRIKGDWMNEISEINSSCWNVGLRFEDDKLYIIRSNGFWQKGKFIINGDTIVVEEYNKRITRFVIQKLTDDSLVLINNGISSNFYRRFLDLNPTLTFHLITLNTGWCYGDCPQLKITVDSLGNTEILKYSKNSLKDQQVFRLETSKLKRIDSLFKQSCINKTDSSGYYGAEDDWEVTIRFDYNIESKTITGTIDQMPYRIREIIIYLLDLQKKEDANKTTTNKR
jgi:hypothetical protein